LGPLQKILLMTLLISGLGSASAQEQQATNDLSQALDINLPTITKLSKDKLDSKLLELQQNCLPATRCAFRPRSRDGAPSPAGPDNFVMSGMKIMPIFALYCCGITRFLT